MSNTRTKKKKKETIHPHPTWKNKEGKKIFKK